MGKNQIKAGAVLAYVNMFIANVISLAYTPVMLRLLGQSEYGLYQLVTATVSNLGLLNFGFSNAYVRYYSIYKSRNEKEKIAKLNGMYLTIFSVLGIVALLCGLGLVVYSDKIFGGGLTSAELYKAKILLAIMVFNLAVSFPLGVFSNIVNANEKFVFLKFTELLKNVCNPLIMLPLLFLGCKSISLTIVVVSLNLLCSFASMFYCIFKLKISIKFGDFDRLLFKNITVFSGFIFINMISDQINWSVDKFILGIYCGTREVAVYGVGAMINAIYLSFSTNLSSVFIPKVNKLVADKSSNDVITDLFVRVGRIQFMILSLLCIGFAVFGKAFIKFWAGGDYSQSYWIALLLIITITVPSIQNIGIEIQKAKNLHKFRSVVYFMIAIVNLFLSIPLAKMYGGIGAAIGTAVSLIVGNTIIMNIYYYKRVGLNMAHFWNEILKLCPAFIINLIIGVVIYFSVNLYIFSNFVIFALLFTVIYVGVMWFMGMNKYEKELIIVPISDFIGRKKHL